LSAFLPAGFQGLAHMIHQWTFTLFYVMSELWGDVILSLNFWVLANETTSSDDAVILYPLFGLGANLAQFISGQILQYVNQLTGQTCYDSNLSFLINLTMVVAVMIWGLHYWIANKFSKERTDVAVNGAGGEIVQLQETKDGGDGGSAEKKLSLKESAKVLLASPVLQSLAVLALAQGITTNLVEIAWKASIRQQHPDPASYSAFMGSVSSALGICTGLSMLISPTVFLRWKWRQAAGVNPFIVLYGGMIFFLGMIFCNWAGFDGYAVRSAILLTGTALYMFGRASKFSLLKPAEEMIYIKLDETSRENGKAAIDVVGTQVGKSFSSLMQQIFLLFSRGRIERTYPMMAMVLVVVGSLWMQSVRALSKLCFEKEENDGEAKEVEGDAKDWRSGGRAIEASAG